MIYSAHIQTINLLIKKSIPFVVYRHPDDGKICIIAQASQVHLVHNIKEVCHLEGFLVFPFESVKTEVGYFIKKDLFACGEEEIKSLLTRLKGVSACKSGVLNNIKPYEITKEAYLDTVEFLINKLKNKELDKVVLSRIKVEKLGDKFSPADFFLKLTEKYSNAFVYLFSFPETGMWIGATPETLLSRKPNGKGVVMALAGTASYKNGNNIIWGKKEIEEQEYVSEFVRLKFHELGIKNYTESPVKTVQAGHLVHLQTIFTIDVVDLSDNLDKLIKELHPTPAVCGLPQHKAYSLIEEVEMHDRKFYSGFLGPWGLNDKSNLFVNLRCAEVNHNAINLYVGGGITADSIPEEEWKETELKAQTLLSQLNAYK